MINVNDSGAEVRVCVTLPILSIVCSGKVSQKIAWKKSLL